MKEPAISYKDQLSYPRTDHCICGRGGSCFAGSFFWVVVLTRLCYCSHVHSASCTWVCSGVGVRSPDCPAGLWHSLCFVVLRMTDRSQPDCEPESLGFSYCIFQHVCQWPDSNPVCYRSHPEDRTLVRCPIHFTHWWNGSWKFLHGREPCLLETIQSPGKAFRGNNHAGISGGLSRGCFPDKHTDGCVGGSDPNHKRCELCWN